MKRLDTPLFFTCLGHFLMHVTVALYLTAVLFIESLWGMPFDVLMDLWWWGALLVGLGAPLAGWLGDRFGRAELMVVFFILTGLSLFVVGAAQSARSLQMGLLFLGGAAAIYHPVGIAWVAGQKSPGRGRALGIVGVFGSAGIALAALVATGLEALFHWRAIFIIPGAISLAAGLVLAVLMRTAPGRFNVPSATSAPLASPPPAQASSHSHSHSPFMVPLFIGFFAIMSLNAVVWHAINIAMPKWFALDLGTGTFLQVGMMVTLVYALAGGSQLISGSLSDRYPPQWVYAATLCLHLPFLLSAGYLTGIPLVLVLAAHVFFLNGALPAESLLIIRLTPPAWLGTAYGLKFVAAFAVQPLALMAVTYSYQNPSDLLFTGNSPFATMLPILVGIGLLAFIGASFLFASRLGRQRLAT